MNSALEDLLDQFATLDGMMLMLMYCVKGCKDQTMVKSYKTHGSNDPSGVKRVCVFFAVGEALTGFGYSDSYIAQDFRCNGTEFSLEACNYTNATENCNGQHVAGFRCRESELITVVCYHLSACFCSNLIPQ